MHLMMYLHIVHRRTGISCLRYSIFHEYSGYCKRLIDAENKNGFEIQVANSFPIL